MQDRKYKVYIDEFGAYGFSPKSYNETSHFILVAVLVEDKDCEELEKKLDDIRARYFQKGEMKSSKIPSNEKGHKRRGVILKRLIGLPFKVFVLSVDKRKLWDTSGMKKSKSVFYKFFNQYLYKALRKEFPNLDFSYDAVGTSEYTESFLKYVRKQSVQPTLFDQYHYQVLDSKSNIIIQLADLIAGSISYSLDEVRKQKACGHDYFSLLKDHILIIQHFPQKYREYELPREDDYPEYDYEIARISYRRAVEYLSQIEESDSSSSVLKYLLFRFMHNSHRQYIQTKELIGFLERIGEHNISEQSFRTKVIAHLRDEGVIIASSTKEGNSGYKIPSTRKEVLDFLNHGRTIIFPMLKRLDICIKAFKVASNGAIDFAAEEGFSDLKDLLENYT